MPPARPGLPVTHTNKSAKLLFPFCGPALAAQFTWLRQRGHCEWGALVLSRAKGVQGPAGLTAALRVCLCSLVRLHSKDVVLSHEVWDSVMKGCFSLSQRKALEYLNTRRAVPGETLSCSPRCALQ